MVILMPVQEKKNRQFKYKMVHRARHDCKKFKKKGTKKKNERRSLEAIAQETI